MKVPSIPLGKDWRAFHVERRLVNAAIKQKGGYYG